MSLDLTLKYNICKCCNRFDSVEFNITHNLTEMADKVGLYKVLWRPEENGITYAKQLIDPITKGLEELKSKPSYYKKFNPSNGWGSYDGFIDWLERVNKACREYPDAEIEANR